MYINNSNRGKSFGQKHSNTLLFYILLLYCFNGIGRPTSLVTHHPFKTPLCEAPSVVNISIITEEMVNFNF